MSKNFDGIFQDWEPVILRNKNAQTKQKAKREGNTETKAKNPMSEAQIRAAGGCVSRGSPSVGSDRLRRRQTRERARAGDSDRVLRISCSLKMNL